jgi:type I restriction enzyme S subunit
MILTPPLPEQTAIAEFLDRETGKIDELVAEQRRLMELLKEKRQAVISHAVTKGLNPHAPMKPSGIEWLGDVPEHWAVKSMRMIASVVRGASPRPAGDSRYFGGDAVPWVTVAEITKDNLVDLTETETFLTEEGARNSRLFLRGSVIYSNSGATLGVPKILRIDACANDGVIAFEKLSRDVLPHFLYQYLASITEVIRDEVKQGAGQPNLNTDIVKSLRLGIPPLDEQRTIIESISELAKQFDTLIAEAQRAIDLLQERRTALISAAVTGQIDVRQQTRN